MVDPINSLGLYLRLGIYFLNVLETPWLIFEIGIYSNAAIIQGKCSITFWHIICEGSHKSILTCYVCSLEIKFLPMQIRKVAHATTGNINSLIKVCVVCRLTLRATRVL